jgi:hypothetical protein
VAPASGSAAERDGGAFLVDLVHVQWWYDSLRFDVREYCSSRVKNFDGLKVLWDEWQPGCDETSATLVSSLFRDTAND